MTTDQAKNLKPKDRVRWDPVHKDGDPPSFGTVTSIADYAVHITWDDGCQVVIGLVGSERQEWWRSVQKV